MNELPRIGVVTIQGGGAFGVDLIGQLQGLVGPSERDGVSTGDAGVAPVAIAGTSAGSIIACLYWLGYNPEEIRDEMRRIFARRHRERFFAGRWRVPGVGFGAFRRLVHALGNATSLSRVWRLAWPGSRRWYLLPVWLPWQLLNIFLGVPICGFRLWTARGLFSGDGFVAEVDSLIRRSRLVQNFAADLPQDRLVTFGDIMGRADQQQVMPFFLIVTDVRAANMRALSCVWPGEAVPKASGIGAAAASGGDPSCGVGTDACSASSRQVAGVANGSLGDSSIVSSVAPCDADVPVALAVRASAGFPLFFTPATLRDPRLPRPPSTRDPAKQDCFVDGGVVSNFPSWVFAAGYRRSLLDSGNPAFVDLAFSPWVHYGLRLPGPKAGDAHTAKAYLRRLAGLLTGAARTRLETKLAETVVRRRDVEATPPPRGTAPHGVFDFDFLADEEKVNAAFARGRADGQLAFRAGDYALPTPCQLAPILAALAEEATSLLAPYLCSSGNIRTNIFVLEGDQLVLRYHHGFAADDTDIGMRLKFDQGIAGLAFTLRQVVLANVGDNKMEPEIRDGSDPFLKSKGAPEVRTDRTWLLSLPIIDLTEAWPDPSDRTKAPLALEFRGPVFGILNVDAPINYATHEAPNANPQVGQNHPAVRAVAHAMKLAAVRAAHYFGTSSESDDDEQPLPAS